MKSNVFILLQATVSSSNTEHILKNENSKIPEWKKKKKIQVSFNISALRSEQD